MHVNNNEFVNKIKESNVSSIVFLFSIAAQFDTEVIDILDNNVLVFIGNKFRSFRLIEKLADIISDQQLELLVEHTSLDFKSPILNLIRLIFLLTKLWQIKKKNLGEKLLRNIGFDTIVESVKIEESFTNILNLLRLVPNSLKEKILSEMNYYELGKKSADDENPFHISYFAKYISYQSTENISQFYNAIGDKKIVDKLKYLSYFGQNKILAQIESADIELYQNIYRQLYQFKIDNIEDIVKLPDIIFHYRWNNVVSRETIERIIGFLSKDKVKEVYCRLPNALDILGRIIYYFKKVYLTSSQRDQLQIIAQHIAEIVQAQPGQENFDKLSMLNYNILNISEKAHQTLTVKLYHSINLEPYIGIIFPPGLLSLLRQFKNQQLEVSAYERKIFDLDFAKVFERSDMISLRSILWELLQINPQQLQKWIKVVSPMAWLKKLKTTNDRESLFLLYSNLHHLDLDLTREIADSLWAKYYQDAEKIRVSDIPFCGFLLYHFNYEYEGQINASYQLADYLANRKMSLNHLAYTFVALRKSYNQKVPDRFRYWLSRLTYFYNPQYDLQFVKDNYPIDQSKDKLITR